MSNIWARIGQQSVAAKSEPTTHWQQSDHENQLEEQEEEQAEDLLDYESDNGNGDEDEEDDFQDDVFLKLQPSARHQVFDKPSWLRDLIGKDCRDDEGLMMLKQSFMSNDLGSNKRQVLAIPIQVQIFRMLHDERLQDRASADGSHQPLVWFQHFFRPQYYPKNNKLDFNFNPLDLNVNLCSVLHSLYMPVVRKSVGNIYGDPKAMALYIAHSFLEPELVCKRTMYGSECFGFPYLIDIQVQSTPTLTKLNPKKAGKTNLVSWIPSERTAYGAYQNKSQHQVDPKRFRFLIWKAFDNSIWSNPIDVDRDDNPSEIAKTLKDTWPMLTEWILENLEHVDSFGYDFWRNRHDRLVLNCHDHLAPKLYAPCSDQVFYPMANYNNDRLVRIASATRSSKQAASSSNSSRDLDDYALGQDSMMPPSQWVYHSHTTMDAFSSPPGQWFDNQHHIGSKREKKRDPNTEWMSQLQEFSTKPISIALLAPNIEQALHQAGLDSSVISCGALSETIIPPFGICAEDAQKHFVPIPPSGHFAIDPTTLIWTSKKCRIVACGIMTTCIEIPWLKLKSKDEDGNANNVVMLKVLDMASLVDQYCLTSANAISPSQREAIVDHAANQFRREIWNMASLPRNKYICDFYGWTLFGSMMCIVQERLACTLSVFLAYFDALVIQKHRNQTGKSKKVQDQDMLALVLSKCAKHAENRNKRIWNESSYQSNMQAKINWMDETFELVKAPSVKLCRALLKCMVQICHALAHMHANGIIHRDVKPSNIMMNASGRCKLIDFGSSTAISQRMLVQVYGTPRFLPINFAQDNVVRYYAHDDGSVDVYAVLEILKTALKPFANMVDRLINKVQEASSYLAEQVLLSVVVNSPEMIRIIVPNKNHEPWILSPSHASHRQQVLQSALTATQLASMISKAAKRLE